ncbi:DUF2683 family protein [Olivibacter sitiensis]|uniref:DUF2683 family protein n=1 Tax=Olivibacter sitiensis TaxID=376470 RepID=UPI00040F8845|nr:DUF2683 family protein [Olivibacter sitiensis]
MTTITISKRTKAGKLLIEMAKLLSEKSDGIVITESEKELKSPYNPEFVKKIKESAANDKRYEVNDIDELWESL